jgi:hypothetical protein
MGKHAVVRGEVHTSDTDRQALFDRDLSDYEAVYMEGRSDTIQLHKKTSSYNLFLLGYFTLDLGYSLVRPLQSRFGSDEYNVKKEARNRGLKFENEIDLEIHQIYDSYDSKYKKLLPYFSILPLMMTGLYAFYQDTISIFCTPVAIPSWLLSVVFAIFTPFIFMSMLMRINNGSDRDERMANQIESKSAEQGHDSILVLVGDKHVDPISDELDEHGWDVEPERSEHWLSQLSRLWTDHSYIASLIIFLVLYGIYHYVCPAV